MTKSTQTWITLGATALLGAATIFTLTLTAIGGLDSTAGRAYEILLAGFLAVSFIAAMAAAIWETGTESALGLSGLAAAVMGNFTAFATLMLGGITATHLMLAVVLHVPAAGGIALMMRGKAVQSPFSLLGFAWAFVVFGVAGFPQWTQSSENFSWWPLWMLPALLIVAGVYADAVSGEDEQHGADGQLTMS